MTEKTRRNRSLGASLLISIGIGFAMVLISVGIAHLPNLFNPKESPRYNEFLPLASFLGNASQGLVILLILALSVRRMSARISSRLLFAGWAAAALVAVAAPAPSIINGAYANTLTGVYAVATGILAAGYSFQLMYWKPAVATAT